MRVFLAIGTFCGAMALSAAPAKAEPHASVVEGAIAGVNLCTDLFESAAMRQPRAGGLAAYYEQWGWRSIVSSPVEFPDDMGAYFGEAALAPSAPGRVISTFGPSNLDGGTRCHLLILDAAHARDEVLARLDASDQWVSLRIPNVPNTRMYGHAISSEVADLGLTIMWGAGEYDAYLSVSLIPKASIATGAFPPDGQ